MADDQKTKDTLTRLRAEMRGLFNDQDVRDLIHLVTESRPLMTAYIEQGAHKHDERAGCGDGYAERVERFVARLGALEEKLWSMAPDGFTREREQEFRLEEEG